MIALKMKSLLLLACLVSSALAQVDLSSYPLSAVLRDRDGEVYTLHWGFDVEAQTIRFAVNVSTTGWVGLGLSPTGGMPNSDVVIGWVNQGGQAFLQDRFAAAQSRPPVDAQQDWFLDGGMEMDGFTILAFRRDWVTCDELDREIKVETARVIYAWNEADPAGDDPDTVVYHGDTKRGTQSLNLLGVQQEVPPDPADVQNFDVTVQNITVPPVGTTYWCSAFELPVDVQQQEHYVTKYSPFITPGNEAYVHHILIYECGGLTNASVGESGVCGDEVSNTVSECRAGTLVAGWAVGGTEFVYPEGVAYPIGGSGPRYFVMETHYDNPGMRTDVLDSSGIVFSYTATAPQHEAGTLQIGHIVGTKHVIPPGAERYTTFGDCSTVCTSTFLPPQRITVFANLLHTHLVGVGATLHHYRTNSECGRLEELPPIEQNLQYDFNYQQYTTLPEPVQVLPGDLLRLECNYNTATRSSVVLGGPATQDEMCLSFASYYPRSSLDACISTPNYFYQDNDYLTDFLANHVSEDVLAQLVQAADQGRTAITNAWNMVDWTPEAIASFESSTNMGPLTDLCIPGTQSFYDMTTITRDGTIQADCDYQAPNNCTGFVPTECCDRIFGGSGVILQSSLMLALCMALVPAML